MSGDVQPRKRKDKKKKKDAADDIQSHFSSEEIMHSHKDVGTGGNICTKVIFYTLLGALLVMIGIILLDQRGITDLDSSDGDSQWAPIFQGWLEDSPSHEDEHLKTADSGEEEHEDHEHDSGIEDENDDEGDEHDEHDEEGDEEENEEDHSGGGDEDDEGLDDDEELDEDEQDGKEDESNQEIDEMQDDEDDNEDSKDEDEEYEGDKSDNEDENDEDEIEESNDDGLEDDNSQEEDYKSQEEDYKSQEEDDKSQEEEEDEEEEQGHDDDDIEDNILFREIPGVVESTEDIEEGNASEEDLNESSEDKKDDAIASGEKIDDQVRNMADRTSGSPTKYNANTVNTEHVTLQNDDKKVDSEFNKPIEDSKKKESVDASMEKSQTLSKNKETAKQNSREKTEAQIQKEDLNKLADSIKATAKDVTSEKSKSETNIISEKVSDNMKEGSQRREANELNINSEKPLKGTDNNKMEQHITEENNQKVSEKAKAIKSPEKDKVKEVEKQSINQLNNIPEKPLRETGSHQKEQDVRQQKYEKVNEEAKVMKSFENKLPEKDKVKEVEKQSINQLNNMPEKPLRETGSHQKKQDVQQQNYDQVNDEKKPSETKVVGKAEKQPIDQKKRDGANTNSFSRKPDSNEKEIRGNKAEKESRKVDDKSSTEHISNDKIDQPQKGNVKSDQKPISDNLQVGNVNKNEETVAQHHPEINDLKGEGQTTGLKLDKQDQKAEKAVNHDIEKMGSNYAKTSSDKMELNVEKTVRQNSEKISEHSHNDKSNKIKIEIDKPTDNKRDDSQQGKVSSSASDKAMGAETVKRTVSSQVPDKSQLTPKQNLEPDETEDKDENGDSGIEAEESDTTGDQQNISDEEDTDERPAPSLSKLSKGPGGEKAQNYVNYDITNDDDWNLIDELDKAAAEKAEVALSKFDLILKSYPNSPRAWYGKATALDQLAELHQSNHILEQAIEAFKKVVALGPTVKDKLLLQAAERCIERMRFKGQHMSAVAVHQVLISRFPNVSKYQNQLAVTYLMINRIQEAKRVLEKVLQHWKNDGFAQVHYGFILKTSGNNLEEAVKYLRNGIATREPGTIDGRFFFQLGDALHRLGRKDEAMKIYEMGVQEKLFLSKYQRSLYNVDRLHAQPWWTPEKTTYTHLFNTLKNKWSEIRREGLAALYEKDINLFQDESENLKDSGKWQQLELYARGRKIQKNCLKAPLTCQLIDAFPMARDCKRGQVKFSVMHAGTHVWPHCGPTNCRLRSHLGLVVPSGTFIRVADETRSWKEGDFIIFDDSFEHEVWHNGTSTRLVLIVDVWHPELTEEEKRTMAAI